MPARSTLRGRCRELLAKALAAAAPKGDFLGLIVVGGFFGGIVTGGGGGENRKKGGAWGKCCGGLPVLVFMFISNLCSPFFVFNRGFLGSLYIVFVEVIIWAVSYLFQGADIFSFERVSPLSSYQVLGCWWCICFDILFVIEILL